VRPALRPRRPGAVIVGRDRPAPARRGRLQRATGGPGKATDTPGKLTSLAGNSCTHCCGWGRFLRPNRCKIPGKFYPLGPLRITTGIPEILRRCVYVFAKRVHPVREGSSGRWFCDNAVDRKNGRAASRRQFMRDGRAGRTHGDRQPRGRSSVTWHPIPLVCCLGSMPPG
jgi:hypothetical protein